ncbi:DinB family protein [Mucilaginibacter psychrotolerans]|uniref:DinB family protein n=1 Tax=Mucilaginibacter psychrotolerans TaxID=1524096 RepID=A0A4Y8SNF8_9SPHI|nr:DinB family protein [Mucilaginibacter psychrotolerans]TFF40200.1 DinB family protein [Mucilaginibacter psychrotolerans]
MIQRPQPNQYPVFAGTYVNMVPEGADVMQLLTDSLTHAYDLFTSLPEDKHLYAYADGKWTVKEVLGHIIDTERVFAFRAFCFSREQIVLPGFDQDIYVNNTDYNSRSLAELAEEFRVTRQSNLYVFRNLTEEPLNRSGTASGNYLTVRALLFMTAGHELHHLRILKERYL